MLVHKKQLSEITRSLKGVAHISLDCEATGLYPYLGDRLFSIIIGVENAEYYFNFNNLSDHLGNSIHADYVLDRREIPNLLEHFTGTIYLHNAKYDMHLLGFDGLDLTDPRFTIHCTQAIARVEYNDRLKYSLDSLAQEIGYKKDDRVKEYANKNKLFDYEQIPGKKTRTKKYHYELIPQDIIVPYGLKDAKITYVLGRHQEKRIKELDAELPEGKPKLSQVMDNERSLTKVLFRMEKEGIKNDQQFTMEALRFETERAEGAKNTFKQISGIDFVDSGKALSTAFDRVGEPYPRTEKGNPSFKDEVLSGMTTPLAKVVQEYRDANKKAFTYYANFLHFASGDGRIHGSFNQSGTATGRMSAQDPNLQNLNKIEKDDPEYLDHFLVRRSFVPKEDHFFAMLDFDQMEYRVMLDYAGQMDLIEEVLAGKDVHQATAELLGVFRKEAKTINFMLLYGGGVGKLAAALNCSLKEAKDKKAHYFRKLPKVEELISRIIATVERRGYIFNWYGRRSYIPKEFSYAAPNYLIQGGCADIVKIAMNRHAEYLQDKKSKLLVQIHDEELFEIHNSEKEIIWDLKRIMENVYPHRYLPLTAGVDVSYSSWQDKSEATISST